MYEIKLIVKVIDENKTDTHEPQIEEDENGDDVQNATNLSSTTQSTI